VTPADNNAAANGSTSFTRTYNTGYRRDADGGNHCGRESIWVVDWMHDGKHGDVQRHAECKYDRDGELHRAGDYGDHGDSDDARDHWNIAAVYGNGYWDGRLYERG
jgi:hypothetical protein